MRKENVIFNRVNCRLPRVVRNIHSIGLILSFCFGLLFFPGDIFADETVTCNEIKAGCENKCDVGLQGSPFPNQVPKCREACGSVYSICSDEIGQTLDATLYNDMTNECYSSCNAYGNTTREYWMCRTGCGYAKDTCEENSGKTLTSN